MVNYRLQHVACYENALFQCIFWKHVIILEDRGYNENLVANDK
jgi:hypothetical protein